MRMLDILDRMGSNVNVKMDGAESTVMVSCQIFASFPLSVHLSETYEFLQSVKTTKPVLLSSPGFQERMPTITPEMQGTPTDASQI